MFPVRVDHVYGNNRGMMNNVTDGGGVRLNNREKVGHSFFKCFVVFVRFWGVVTAIGKLLFFSRGIKLKCKVYCVAAGSFKTLRSKKFL